MAQRFSIGGEWFDFLDVEDAPRMTWPEVKFVCKATGKRLNELHTGDPDVLQAFVLVSVKRKRPEFTMSDLDDVMLEVIDTLEDAPEGDAPDPTETDQPTSSG